jgi:hypothetical protein
MRPRTKGSLLWGVVGGLAFLALVQGYELLADPVVPAALKAAVAVAVGIAAAGATHAARPLVGNESS